MKYTSLQQRIKIHALHNFLEFRGAFDNSEFGRHGKYYILDDLMVEVRDVIRCDIRTIKRAFEKMHSEDLLNLFTNWNEWYCGLEVRNISKEDQDAVDVLHDMKILQGI